MFKIYGSMMFDCLCYQLRHQYDERNQSIFDFWRSKNIYSIEEIQNKQKCLFGCKEKDGKWLSTKNFTQNIGTNS